MGEWVPIGTEEPSHLSSLPMSMPWARLPVGQPLHLTPGVMASSFLHKACVLPKTGGRGVGLGFIPAALPAGEPGASSRLRPDPDCFWELRGGVRLPVAESRGEPEHPCAARWNPFPQDDALL